MIDRLLKLPKALQKKIFFTAAAGAGILLAGITATLYFNDHIILLLSIILFSCCLSRAVRVGYATVRGRYRVLSGKCISIAPITFTGYVQITIDDIERGPTSCRLLKYAAPDKVGEIYRLYFSEVESGFTQDNFLEIESIQQR